MWYNLIPIIVILACIVGIMVIIVRKFPQLTALHVESLPEVKQAQVKRALQLQHFWRTMAACGVRLKKTSQPLAALWHAIREKFRAKVRELEETYAQLSAPDNAEPAPPPVAGVAPHAPQMPVADAQSDHAPESIDAWLHTAGEYMDRNAFKEAEQCFIEALKLDKKNIEAYRGLGKVYLETDRNKQAIEVFAFLLKISPDDDRALNRMAMAYMAEGRNQEAVRALERAVEINDTMAIRFFDLGRLYMALERPAASLRNFAKAAALEPGNPKYLDQLLEISIMTEDGNLARETYQRLKEANPDNRKLLAFKKRVSAMG